MKPWKASISDTKALKITRKCLFYKAFTVREQEVGCSNHLTPTILVLYAQKISPFRKIGTDFLFVFHKSTKCRFCLIFARAQVPGTRDRFESILRSFFTFLKKTFSLLDRDALFVWYRESGKHFCSPLWM